MHPKGGSFIKGGLSQEGGVKSRSQLWSFPLRYLKRMVTIINRVATIATLIENKHIKSKTQSVLTETGSFEVGA